MLKMRIQITAFLLISVTQHCIATQTALVAADSAKSSSNSKSPSVSPSSSKSLSPSFSPSSSYQTNQIDMVDFPQLPALIQGTPIYTNYTCANRCCRQAAVNKDPNSVPECAQNWKACAVLDPGSSLESCYNVSSPWTPCKVWVPCDPNDRNDVYIGLGVVLTVYTVSCFAVIYYCYYITHVNKVNRSESNPLQSCHITISLVLFIILTVISMLATVPGSDYKHWEESTEVDKAFISSQSCYEATMYYLQTTTSFSYTRYVDSDSYYSLDRCDKSTDDWKTLREATTFLTIRAYVMWIMALLTVVLYALTNVVGFIPFSIFIIILPILHFVCIILEAFYMHSTNTHGGIDYMDSYTKQGQIVTIAMYDVCASFIPFDIISASFAAVIANLTLNSVKNKENYKNSSFTDKISPKDVIVVKLR